MEKIKITIKKEKNGIITHIKGLAVHTDLKHFHLINSEFIFLSETRKLTLIPIKR